MRELKTLAPVVEIDVAGPAALGAEFLRWEIATAIAGALISIDPFDQPNVQQAKDASNALLAEYTTKGRLPIAPPDQTIGGIALTLTSAARATLTADGAETILTLLHQGDYFALLAYLGPEPALADELQTLRRAVRDRARVATTFGYGPRYLHSTGQLHKGGPEGGRFLVLVHDGTEDVEIPGRPFSFRTLKNAQALGDLQTLRSRGRRAEKVRLEGDDAAAAMRELTARVRGLLGG